MLTVREALNIGVMRRARLIAGSGGLARTIRSITIMDTPDISEWLRGGEMLLSNIYVIKDNPDKQVQLVQDAARKGAAAVGIKLKRYVEAVPSKMVDSADALNLPLIEMPTDCAWIDVMVPLYSEIINRQASCLSKAQEIHETFTRAALEGRGVHGVIELLSSITGCPAAMVDRDGRLLAGCPTGAWEGLSVEEEFKRGRGVQEGSGAHHPVGLASASNDERRGARRHPVKAGNELQGYVLIETDDPAPESDLVALEHASTVLALEMAKRKAVSEVERRFRNDVLWDLFHGEVESRECLEARAGPIGIDVSSAHAVMVFDVDEFERYCMEVLHGDDAKARDVRERFVRAVHSAVSRHAPGGLCMDLSDSVTVLLPTAADDEHEALIRLADGMKRDISNAIPSISVSVGISRPRQDLLEIVDAYDEGRRALALGRELKGKAHATYFEELGSYRVLLSVGDPSEARRFCWELMSPLVGYEEKRPGLIKTLTTYFRCNGDPVSCAEELFVHANTVRYRLRKIETLCGVSLDNEEDRFNLQLALKLYRLFFGPRSEK